MNMVVLKHLLRNEEMGAYDKACNKQRRGKVYPKYKNDCEIIANQLEVPVEFILAVAAAKARGRKDCN